MSRCFGDGFFSLGLGQIAGFAVGSQVSFLEFLGENFQGLRAGSMPGIQAMKNCFGLAKEGTTALDIRPGSVLSSPHVGQSPDGHGQGGAGGGRAPPKSALFVVLFFCFGRRGLALWILGGLSLWVSQALASGIQG